MCTYKASFVNFVGSYPQIRPCWSSPGLRRLLWQIYPQPERDTLKWWSIYPFQFVSRWICPERCEDSVIRGSSWSSSFATTETPFCFPSCKWWSTRDKSRVYISGHGCGSVMKRYVAAEGPRLLRCSGIRWVRLAEAALASTTTRPRSGTRSAERRAYNHSTPEHPSGYAVWRCDQYAICRVRMTRRKSFVVPELYRYASGEPFSSSSAVCSCPLLLVLLSPELEAHLHETRANAGASRWPAKELEKRLRAVSRLHIWWLLDQSVLLNKNVTTERGREKKPDSVLQMTWSD